MTLDLSDDEADLLQDAVAALFADYFVRMDNHRDDPRLPAVQAKFDVLTRIGVKLGMEL